MIRVFAAAVCIAFSLAVVLTPLVRRLAFRVGAVDVPDGRRRIHTEPTARMGGLAVAVAFFAAIALAKWVLAAVARTATPDEAAGMLAVGQALAVWPLVIPSLIILGTGIYDDIASLRPRVKLLFQILAAAAFCTAGWRIQRVGGVQLPVYVSYPATMLWLVACANALNLFDGMDGLASGVGVFASVMIFGLACLFQDTGPVAVLAAGLGGACLGFLLFNFPPALVFLGDTGSLFIGMMLGALAIEGSYKSHLAFALVVPILALGLPMVDTLLAVLRRVSRRVSVFSADKDHLHHRLIAAGFTRRQALVLLYGISICLASLSLIVAFSNNLAAGLLIVAAGGLILMVARVVGASELREFGFFVLGGLRRRGAVARQRRVLKDGMRSLEAAVQVGDAAERALADLTDLGFDEVRIAWDGQTFRDGTIPAENGAENLWRWDAQLNAGAASPGRVTVMKRGGPHVVAPEVLPLLMSYTEALGNAFGRAAAAGKQTE